MPNAFEELKKLQAIVDAGGGNERVTPVIVVRKSNAEKVANKPNAKGRRKTKFIFETDSPECYSRLNKYKDMVLTEAGNKAIGIELLIRAWRTLASNKQLIQKWIDEGHLAYPGT